MSDIPTTDTPLWMQNKQYAARLDRSLLEGAFQHLGVRGCAVTPRGAGANLSVDVAAGLVMVTGENQANQGRYLARLQAVNMPTLANPTGAGQKRLDRLVIAVQDPNAGGPAGDNAVLRWVQGTPTTGTPTPPATPTSATLLADVQLINGQASVLAADITDYRVIHSHMKPNVPSPGFLTTAVPGPVDGDSAFVRFATINCNYHRLNGVWRQQAFGTGAWLRRAAVAPVVTNAGTAIQWDTEDYDSDGFFTPPGVNLTVPTGLGGVFDLHAHCVWANHVATSDGIALLVNGQYVGTESGANVFNVSSVDAVGIPISAGQTISALVFQNSGGNVNMNSATLYVSRRP